MRTLLVCERTDTGPRYKTIDGPVLGGLSMFAEAAVGLLSKTQIMYYTTLVVCKRQLQHAHFLTDLLVDVEMLLRPDKIEEAS